MFSSPRAPYAHGSAGKRFAEHDAGRAGIENGMHRFQNFMRRAADVRGEDQPESAAPVFCFFDRRHRQSGAFLDG